MNVRIKNKRLNSKSNIALGEKKNRNLIYFPSIIEVNKRYNKDVFYPKNTYLRYISKTLIYRKPAVTKKWLYIEYPSLLQIKLTVFFY